MPSFLPVTPFECEALGVNAKVDKLDLGVVLPLTGISPTLSAKACHMTVLLACGKGRYIWIYLILLIR